MKFKKLKYYTMSTAKNDNSFLIILIGTLLIFISSLHTFAEKSSSQSTTPPSLKQAPAQHQDQEQYHWGQEQAEMIRKLSKEQKLSNFFRAGSEAYEKGFYEKAEQFFLQALETSPQNAAILTNLGLVKYRKRERGHAVGLWRKALTMDPHFEPARQALSYSLKELPALPSSPIHSRWEKFRKLFLIQMPFSFYMSCCLISFLLASIPLIRYWSQKRRSKLQHFIPASFPLKSPFLFFISFVSFALASMQTLDQLQTRATIIKERVPAYLAPSLQQPELFFLFAGGEVLVKKNAENWVQVQSAQGMTGWVPRKFLFYTSGSSVW